LYWEYKGGFFNVKGVSIPVAVSIFPGEQYQAPRSWTEGLSQPHLLQRGRQGRTLRRVGTAGTLRKRATGRVPLPPLAVLFGRRRCLSSAAVPGGSSRSHPVPPNLHDASSAESQRDVRRRVIHRWSGTRRLSSSTILRATSARRRLRSRALSWSRRNAS